MVLLLVAFLPQAPDAAIEDPAQLARWLAQVRPRLGQATAPLFNLGLLSIRHAPWLRFILAGATLSVLIRLYGCVEALREAQHPATVRAPGGLLANPETYHSEHTSSAPSEAIGELAARLRRRGYRVRVEADANGYALVADRPLARSGPALAHVGLLVLLLGAAWNAVAGWEQTGVTLAPGLAVTAGRGPMATLTLESTSAQGEAQITVQVGGAQSADQRLAPGATGWSGNLAIRLAKQGPAVQLSGSHADGAPVMLLAAPGATPVPALTLLITPERPEPAAFAPAQALALQAEAHSANTVRLRALRGNAGELVVEDEIAGRGTLTVDDVHYEVSVAPYASVDVTYQPGRFVLIGGGLLAGLGMFAWALYRPRRVWAIATQEDGATVVKLADDRNPLVNAPAEGYNG
jgi:cytochrome c biogenesis protein ResB